VQEGVTPHAMLGSRFLAIPVDLVLAQRTAVATVASVTCECEQAGDGKPATSRVDTADGLVPPRGVEEGVPRAQWRGADRPPKRSCAP